MHLGPTPSAALTWRLSVRRQNDLKRLSIQNDNSGPFATDKRDVAQLVPVQAGRSYGLLGSECCFR